jgi:hypothetical protein
VCGVPRLPTLHESITLFHGRLYTGADRRTQETKEQIDRDDYRRDRGEAYKEYHSMSLGVEMFAVCQLAKLASDAPYRARGVILYGPRTLA